MWNENHRSTFLSSSITIFNDFFKISLSHFMGETERDYLLFNFIRISNIFSFSKMFFSQPWIICGLLKIIFLPNFWRPKDFFSPEKKWSSSVKGAKIFKWSVCSGRRLTIYKIRRSYNWLNIKGVLQNNSSQFNCKMCQFLSISVYIICWNSIIHNGAY